MPYPSDGGLWDALLRRARTDPTGHHVVRALETGHDRELVLLTALLASLDDNDSLRAQVVHYAERHAAPILLVRP